MGVWDPSSQLEAELASNLRREMCKMVEYEMKFENFRFGAWPPASGHGEYIYIYIYRILSYYPHPPIPHSTHPNPTCWGGAGRGGGARGVGGGWGIRGVEVVG